MLALLRGVRDIRTATLGLGKFTGGALGGSTVGGRGVLGKDTRRVVAGVGWTEEGLHMGAAEMTEPPMPELKVLLSGRQVLVGFIGNRKRVLPRQVSQLAQARAGV